LFWFKKLRLPLMQKLQQACMGIAE